MLRIIIDGIEVDYPDDISITITKTNPFFAENSFNEGSSYSFTLDRTPIIEKMMYSNNGEKQKLSAQIFFQSFLVVNGLVSINNTKDNKVNVNLVEEGTDLRQRLMDTHFKELPLLSVQICDEADIPTTKIQKWYDHMIHNTLVEAPEEGTHKFPKINATFGYKRAASTAILNWLFDTNNRTINAYSFNDYIKNEGVPSSYNPITDDQKGWFVTISPCPRIEYILIETLKFMGVTRINNRLSEIPEFLQMYNFSGYCLDKVEGYGTDKYNVHGTGFDLSNHLPDNVMFSVFELLTEVFEAYYIQQGNSLDILIRDDVLKKKPIDMSKWAEPNFSRKPSSGKTFEIAYSIDKDYLKYYSNYLYSEVALPYVKVLQYANVVTSESSNVKTIDVEMKHVPLNSAFGQLRGVYKTYSDWLSNAFENMYGWEEFSSSMVYLKELISDEYDEGFEKETTFNYGLLRGLFTTRRDVFDPGVPIGSTPIKIGEIAQDHMYNYGFRELQINEDTKPAFAPYSVVLGETSAYLSGDDDIFNKYKKNYFDFISNYREVTKNLNLPIHEAMKVMNWKEPKHIIHQRNLSFQGIVKDATFTITKKNISTTTLTYAVKNSNPMNDFNGDFNDDYLN